MNVSSSTNDFQSINAYQRPVAPEQSIAPEQPQGPKTDASPNDVYEASNGNAIADRNGNLSLTPEGEQNIANAQQAKADEQAVAVQDKKDDIRGTAVDYAGAQSKKSQVEIYLAVATEDETEVGGNNTVNVLESLRETQKQNNVVQAYAQYQENQNTGLPALFAS